MRGRRAGEKSGGLVRGKRVGEGGRGLVMGEEGGGYARLGGGKWRGWNVVYLSLPMHLLLAISI